MKSKLLILALVVVLTACADGCETVAVAAETAPAVVEPAPVAPVAPVVEPTPVEPVGVIYCPQNTNGCAVSPTPVPVRGF